MDYVNTRERLGRDWEGIQKGIFRSLTHWAQDKMASICQMTFWNGFSWMKMGDFRLRFHWSFLKVQINNIPALVYS